MTAERLFDAALVSASMFEQVMAYLDYVKDHEDDEEHRTDSEASESSESAMSTDSTDGHLSSPTVDSPATTHVSDSEGSVMDMDTDAVDPFSVLPHDVGLRILRSLYMVDQLRFARVSRSCSILVADALQIAASQQLLRFNLRFGPVRLMQAATGAVISGSVLTAIAHSGPSFVPDDLDIVTGRRRGYEVVLFLEYMDYVITKKSIRYRYTAGVGKVWTLRHKHNDVKINILESLTENPLDAICHFHSTCVYGAWTARGLWYGYAQLLMAGCAITTPTRLAIDVTSLTNQQRLWRILRKYMDRGFSFSLNQFDAPHVCGVHRSCPATLRSSDDAGCIYPQFLPWQYSHDAEKHRTTVWSMGGTGCAQGILASPNASAAPFLMVETWRLGVEELMTKVEKPEQVVSLLGFGSA
ncbi:hypothetical protein B0H11DRAFT_2245907 [Mycena galericulata]|nr:hypothetical protein B0H11DRAFT_2245907 [Mycena galericulata]